MHGFKMTSDIKRCKKITRDGFLVACLVLVFVAVGRAAWTMIACR
jgi:hypothetical protein